MPRRREPRFPWAPIAARCAELHLPMSSKSGDCLASRIGPAPRQVQRWAVEGVTDLWADRIALALSTMPGELWPDWYEVGLQIDLRTPQERQRALWRAQAAKKKWRRANAAQQAGVMREYRLGMGPEAKAKKAAANRRWYAANAERQRERARQVYAAKREEIRLHHAVYYRENREKVNARRKQRRSEQRAQV